MHVHYQTDNERVELYLRENESWLSDINRQMLELDELSNQLKNLGQDEDPETVCLNHLIREQHRSALKLNDALYFQQSRLADDELHHRIYDTDALCTQDLLRNNVKENMKKYLDLKCDLMNYFSGAL